MQMMISVQILVIIKSRRINISSQKYRINRLEKWKEELCFRIKVQRKLENQEIYFFIKIIEGCFLIIRIKINKFLVFEVIDLW